MAAQLEVLRALGILDSDGEDDSEVEANAGEDLDDGGSGGRFLLPLPPAPSPWTPPFPLPERLERWALDSCGSSNEEKRASGLNFGRSGYSSSDSSLRSSSHPSEILQRCPRSRRPTARLTPPRSLNPATIDCFERWKSFTAEHRRSTGLRLLADACLKKRGVNRWCGFLHWAKYEHERTDRLDRWRAARACRLWRAWTSRRRRVLALLSLDGRSFVNRCRKQQVWRRWHHFAHEEKLARLLVSAQRNRSDSRRLRNAWNELIAHAFRSTQARQLVCRCFKRLIRYRHEQLERHRVIGSYRLTLEAAKLRRILKSWRMLAYSSGYDRRCVDRVRFGIVRKRFFALWRQVYRTRVRTAKFRSRVERQRLVEHFRVWCVMKQVVVLASRITLARDARHLRTLFEQWVRESALHRTFKAAKEAVEARRLSRAISRLMNLTALSRKRLGLIHELRATHEKRLMRLVWMDGWIRFHRDQQHQRRLNACVIDALMRRVFKHWVAFHSDRSIRHRQYESASTFQRIQSCRKRWGDWKAFVNMRRVSSHALEQASRHHANQLLRFGVAQWWGTVRSNSHVVRRTLVIRQNQRNRLKARCFASWKDWVHTRQQQAALVNRLKRSPTYPHSVCNPTRRAWHRWSTFVVLVKQVNHSRLHYCRLVQRKALRAWCRHAFLANQLRTTQLQRNDTVRRQAFTNWRLCVDQRRRRTASIHTAMLFHRIKTSRRAFDRWVKITAEYLRRLRFSCETLERQHKLRLQTRWLRVWMKEFRSRQHISHAIRRRQSYFQRLVVGSWHQYASKQVNLRRKLEYFQNIYGNYPRSSLVRRMWQVWRHVARRAKILRSFKQCQRRRSMRTCWTAWRSFARYRCMFRAWRSITLASGVSSPSFRVRYCRKMRRRHLKMSVLRGWKQMLVERRSRVEHFSRLRFQVYLELRDRLATLQGTKMYRARRWFRRWRFSENRASVRCMRKYQSKLLRKVLQSWWRLSIHARQEQVLHDAKRIIGTMSYYQEPISALVMARPKPAQLDSRTRVKEDDRRTVRHLRKARRLMMDPAGPIKYSELSGHAMKTLSREGPVTPNECSTAFPTRQMRSLDPDPNLLTHDSIDRKCRRTRPPRGNENISLMNVPTPSLDCQDKPDRNAAPGLKSLQRHAPVSHSPLDGVRSDAPTHTASIEGHDAQQSKAPMPFHRRGNCIPAVLHANEDARQRPFAEARCGSAVVELPLFDKDCELPEHRQPSVLAIMPMRIENTKHVTFKLASPSRPASRTTVNAETTPHLSLESLAHLDVYGDLPHPASTATDNILRETPRKAAPTKSKAASHEITVEKTDNRTCKRPIVKLRQSVQSPIRRVFADSKASEKRPLSDILGLSSTQSQSRGSTQSTPASAIKNRASRGAQRSLDDIVIYYAQQLHPSGGSKSMTDAHSAPQLAWRVCFEMARDLHLLRNDFYICELERVFRVVRFMPSDGGAAQLPAENASILARDCEQLKLFLHETVTAHPAYIEAVKARSAPSSSVGDLVFEPLSRVDELQYPSLSWLIGAYLPLFLDGEAQTTVASNHEKYSSCHTMPQNMKNSLDKFVPVIKKYTDILGQFFARGAGAFRHPSVGAIDPRDYCMTRSAFFALMKQARVFPQLFHRRELERAFGLSTMAYRTEDAVNFPEFVELLARCSSSLQWGSSCRLDNGEKNGDLENGADVNTGADTACVVKFLMLIFAMEGRGSVLRKRSKDLDVVIEFLNLQQRQSREHKMKRFKMLLAQQETAHRAQRKERSRQATSPVAKVLSLLSASKRAEVRSPSAVTTSSPAKTFDDLTHSWDFESQGSTGTYDQEIVGSGEPTQATATAKGEDSTSVVPTHSSLKPPTARFDSFESDEGLAIAPDNCTSDSTVDRPLSETLDISDSLCEGKEHLRMEQANGVSSCSTSVERLDLAPQSRARGSLFDTSRSLDKNEFLDEILTSIGDVELILHQSSRLPARRRPRNPSLLDDTVLDGCNSDHVGSSQLDLFGAAKAIEPQTATHFTDESIMTNEPSGSSLGYITSDLGEFSAQCDDDGDDVQVKDAMLDFLTDAARFSDGDRRGESDCI